MIKPLCLDHSSLKHPLPPKLIEELQPELQKINEYPSGGSYDDLCKKTAEYFAVSTENILPTNGSDEAIEATTRAFGNKLILIPAPTFSQYEVSASRNNMHFKLSPCLSDDNYQLKFINDNLEDASLVWICNPNNPTGNSIPREKIIETIEKTSGIVTVDECNYEYLKETVIDLVKKYPNLVVIRSFSKNFGLAGLRIGFVISSSKNIKNIKRYCQYFRVNKIAEKAAIKVLHYLDEYQEIWNDIAVTRDTFVDNLQHLKIKAFPSKTNFVLIDLHTKKETRRIWEYLRSKKVYVLASWEDEFSGLGDHYIRFAIGSSQEMNYVFTLLKNFKK
ncbi:MAG: histidinol-phosphate transaminase [Atribacterota bacterium]|nr:histidinol-phosphate transaminase [Atribacterota bacterium]